MDGSVKNSKTQNRRSNWLICLMLAAVTLAVYWRVAGFPTICFDDPFYVTYNPAVQAGLSAHSIGWAFRAIQEGNWHPLTWISLMADSDICRAISSIFGTGNAAIHPGVDHAVNLILHILNVLLLFAVLQRMTGKRWRSAFVAALFAVHPLHVESVAWISERKDVLSTFFWMLTTWAYISYAQNPSAKRYAFVLLAFVLGLLSKPMLVSLPIVLLILDYWPLSRAQKAADLKPLVREKIPLFALSAAECVVTLYAQKAGGALGSLREYSLGMRIANACVSYMAYLLKMIAPRNLSVFYPHPLASLPIWQVILSAVALVGISILAIKLARRHPYLFVGWLWYVITLIPVIGIVQIGTQGMADRYTYVPLIGAFIAAAWGVGEALRNERRVIGLLAASVVAALAVSSYSQVGYWRDGISLFSHAVQIDPANPFAQANLGLSYGRAGDPRRAIICYEKALRLKPDYTMVDMNLGTLLAKLGHLKEAVGPLASAVRLDPSDAAARDCLGSVLAAQGKLRAAAAQFSKACRIDPEVPDLRRHLQTAEAQYAHSLAKPR